MTKDAGQVALLCHQNADPDAVCSSFVLQKLLEKLSPGIRSEICCPEGVSSSTKKLLENLGIAVPGEKLPGELDLAILVDTNTLDQLGKARGMITAMGGKLVVVDHHHPHPDTEKVASLMIVDESAAAAAEVVYQLVKAAKTELEAQEASALLAALFVETKHFLLARKSTFNAAAGLVEAGADPRRLSEVLSSPMNRSERIARLKGAERSVVENLGDWIIVTSQLGSYQSSAARALLGLGAHVAIVGGDTGKKVRANMRATESFASKTGVHLGRDLAIPLGKSLGGTGGGHSTAAGLTTTVGVEETLKACVDRIKSLLGPFQT
jgi:bifunctional oligoribonuclease and PAP phosphatase NrnA